MSKEDSCLEEPPSLQDLIANVKYVAAPMVDLSHLAFRLLCRKYNVHLCYTPMLHAQQFITDPLYREENFTTCFKDRPLIVQFCANKPATFLAAAKLVQEHCDAVDLNLGCPQVIAKRGHYGAYLQEDWELIRQIITCASSQLKIPVTGKIRILSGDISETVSYAKMLEECGCKLIAVHGRTRDQRGSSMGLADWKAIGAIKAAVKIPVIANGNILNFADVKRCLAFTRCDAVMSAEGLLHNPALFSQKEVPFWEIAEEYLELCRQYPVQPRTIRTILFRICSLCFLIHQDLQPVLGQARSISDFQKICQELKSRIYDPHLSHSCQVSSIRPVNASEKTSCQEELLTTTKDVDFDLCEKMKTLLSPKDENVLDENDMHSTPIWICQALPRNFSEKCKTSLKSLLEKDEDLNVNSTELLNKSNLETIHLSKNQERKVNRHHRILEGRKAKRKLQKQRWRQRKIKLKEEKAILTETQEPPVIAKRQNKQIVREKLSLAKETAPCVCIDLGFSQIMSMKEKQKLAGQLRRLYGSNRNAEQPLSIIFTNFEKNNSLHEICRDKNDGFDNYLIEMTEKSHLELFDKSKLIYLSPDSPHPLLNIDSQKVYVIGGLVDETVNKCLTLNEAKAAGLETARLPIVEYLQKQEKGTFSQVLTVNQVFEILLKYFSCGNWTQALMTGIPARKGYACSTSL